jgi:type II secretion system protein G
MKTKVFSDSVFRVQESSQNVALPLLPSALKTENRKRKTPSAFTLIELLVVIAIIAILAGLILSTAGFVQKKGATARAEAEIAALSAALESYKADNGDYPAGTNATASATGSNNFLLTNLMPPTGKVYFEFTKGMTNTSGYIVDPFGNSYCYRYPGAATNSGTNFFDLWSTAGNATNTNAWIKNW